MSKSIINSQIRNGVWQGELTKAKGAPPRLTISHQGVALDQVTCTADSARGVWRISVPIPATMMNDGLQTFVVTDEAGSLLASFSLLAGEALADDLRAEIDLLRAELDLLKKAFRTHCAKD